MKDKFKRVHDRVSKKESYQQKRVKYSSNIWNNKRNEKPLNFKEVHFRTSKIQNNSWVPLLNCVFWEFSDQKSFLEKGHLSKCRTHKLFRLGLTWIKASFLLSCRMMLAGSLLTNRMVRKNFWLILLYYWRCMSRQFFEALNLQL